MKTHPKLRWPISTKGLSKEDRNILLAYDMIWRMIDRFTVADGDLWLDANANLSNLGWHIEHVICMGNASERFESDNENLIAPIIVGVKNNSDSVVTEKEF